MQILDEIKLDIFLSAVARNRWERDESDETVAIFVQDENVAQNVIVHSSLMLQITIIRGPHYPYISFIGGRDQRFKLLASN